MNRYHTSDAFDVIVVGGGHAGVEAAYTAARLGSRTLLITLNIDRIGHMPCNPAIGGIGKGHIVFEIAALGGLMPQLATHTYLHSRMLNTSKGPAVQGLRLQIDKHAYRDRCLFILEQTPNLVITMGMVEEIIHENKKITGVRTREGAYYSTKTIVVTTGTFLNGLVHIGHTNYTAGRQGEEAACNLSQSLRSLNLTLGRLKTGTPPRLLRSSLDFSRMDTQPSDNLNYLFEFYPHTPKVSMPCYITSTTPITHEIIRQNAALSPIYTGIIKGTPPRYCPSIEDKISRFASKTGHHVFVEPESASSQEMYPNGLSTSLPLCAQLDFIRSIPGFENALIARPGYAIEYDFVLPTQLTHTLEAKECAGLFLAGQINGTTGYEEAAGQGIVAGINAHNKACNLSPFVLNRNESYIGIMIDDLVSLGVDEPYRMFTSRAERRLILRQDNAFIRLGPRAHQLGLINTSMHDDIQKEQKTIAIITEELRAAAGLHITQLLSKGETQTVNAMIDKAGHGVLTDREKLAIYAEFLYGPYLKREAREIEKSEHHAAMVIPHNLEYTGMPGLSIELQQKLMKYRPQTIAQAALIQGMTPAAIALLIFRAQENRSDHHARPL